MARVELDKLLPGMRLCKPVLNLHGVLLLKAGEVLTERHLGILSRFGIQEADVVQGDDREPDVAVEAPLPEEVLEAVQRETAHRFRRAEASADPAMAEILRVVRLRACQRHAESVRPTLPAGPGRL